MSELERAWEWREKLGFFASPEFSRSHKTNQDLVLRVFHGPGEARGTPFQDYAIDLFGKYAWITHWESERQPRQTEGRGAPQNSAFSQMIKFLEKKGIQAAVGLSRPEKGLPGKPTVFFGTPPEEPFVVQEGNAQYQIRLKESRHPGLFLDHQPLRHWLFLHSRGLKVLNTFAYTGSLSVAAALGGAKEVLSVDLSKPTLQWAEENFKLNSIEGRCPVLAGDVFQILPKLRREGQKFDLMILDPPSFSHGKSGKFSTAKDLPKLHEQALRLLNPRGVLITSINSSNISQAKFEADLLLACGKEFSLKILKKIEQPETFPTPLRNSDPLRYLKGWILQLDR